MNKRIKVLLNAVQQKDHHVYRRDADFKQLEDPEFMSLSPMSRVAECLSMMLNSETPVILNEERIVFTRTIKRVPSVFSVMEWEKIKLKYFLHEQGRVCNITPNYSYTIQTGLEERRKEAQKRLELCRQDNNREGTEFLEAVIKSIDAVINLAGRYRKKAIEMGNTAVAKVLERVPRHGATTFHEALQFFRILHFTLWCEGEYHNTVGRFDQYMYPYLKADMDKGILNKDSAFELLEEFFISFNKDSDMYPGVQQGDNGQSLVLGGVNENGQFAFNLLSEMCLNASRELKLIDPKINLRVKEGMQTEIYELGTELTKEGLGFPQYSNDDVIIPGLIRLGYNERDARNYSMAACWETIIPGCGMDIPNISALSFPKIIDKCVHEYLKSSGSFEFFLEKVKNLITEECRYLTEELHNLWMIPAPFMSVLMDGCINNARDISQGSKYNNFGIHGTGLSTAVDSLAAVKKLVFEEKSLSAGELIDAVDKDFEGYDELLNMLRFETPKMGNDDDYADSIAVKLLDIFANTLEPLRNERGGCFRAGTGTAMYYLWHVKDIGASPDGRRKGEPLSANYSPTLFAKVKGPISVIKSFTKPNLVRTVNGGPLTLEFHETVFKDEESKKKVAMLVKSFIDMHGNQLQLNAVNRDTLIEAQKNPDKYRNLIVRVWGWSAYFIELDKGYQDHIIRRTEF